MKIFLIILVLLALGFYGARLALKQAIGQYFGFREFVAIAFIAGAGLTISDPLIFLPIALLAAIFPWPKTHVHRITRFLLLCALTPEFTHYIFIGEIHLIDLRPRDMYLLGLAITSLMAPNARNGRAFGAEFLLILAFVAVLWVGGSRDLAPTSLTRTGLRILIDYPLTFYFLYRNIRSLSDLKTFLGVGVAAAIVLGIVGVYEARAGWSVFEGVLRHLQEDFVSRNFRIRSGFMRSPTTFTEATSFAVFQMTFMVVAISARDLFRNSFVWAGGVTIIALGLLTTQSRGAFMGAAAGALIAMIVSRAFGRAAITGALVAASSIMLAVFAKSNARLTEFATAGGLGTADNYRQRLLERGTQEGMKHFWFGDGISSVFARMPDLITGEKIIDPVNTYLYFFWAGGVVGLFAIILCVAAVLARLIIRGFNRRSSEAFKPEAVLSGMIVSILVAILFTSFYERNPLWLVAALACARALSRPGFVKSSAQRLTRSSADPAAQLGELGPATALRNNRETE